MAAKVMAVAVFPMRAAGVSCLVSSVERIGVTNYKPQIPLWRGEFFCMDCGARVAAITAAVDKGAATAELELRRQSTRINGCREKPKQRWEGR